MWTTGRMHGPRTTPPPPLHPAQWFNKTFLGVILSTSQEEMKQTGPQWREWELVKWSVTSFSIRWEHFPLRCLELPMVADGDGGGGPGPPGLWLTGVTTLHGGEETLGQWDNVLIVRQWHTATLPGLNKQYYARRDETPLDLVGKTNSHDTLSDWLPL